VLLAIACVALAAGLATAEVSSLIRQRKS